MAFEQLVKYMKKEYCIECKKEIKEGDWYAEHSFGKLCNSHCLMGYEDLSELKRLERRKIVIPKGMKRIEAIVDNRITN